MIDAWWEGRQDQQAADDYLVRRASDFETDPCKFQQAVAKDVQGPPPNCPLYCPFISAGRRMMDSEVRQIARSI